MSDPERQRQRMVEHDLRARGITDAAVLEAMGAVPRHRFVPAEQRRRAYRDGPLPIGAGQTISQPYIVALMAEGAGLSPSDRVLEIGTGSGYGAAVLGAVAAEVITIERVPALAERARRTLEDCGITNVTVRTGDGSTGAADAAPFDAIVVTAAAPSIPEELLDQLVEGGRLVVPVGPEHGTQELLAVTRHGDDHTTQSLCPVRFVPLLGAGGQRPG